MSNSFTFMVMCILCFLFIFFTKFLFCSAICFSNMQADDLSVWQDVQVSGVVLLVVFVRGPQNLSDKASLSQGRK